MSIKSPWITAKSGVLPPSPSGVDIGGPTMHMASLGHREVRQQGEITSSPDARSALQIDAIPFNSNIRSWRTPSKASTRSQKEILRQSTPMTRRHSGTCFLVIVVHIILFEYLCYVGILLRPLIYPIPTPLGLTIAVSFHFLFTLTIISFVQCVITDPGSVPPNWGFYMGDKNKRRRYCAVCNIWKPDRTHHCSACQRCILNMDHHCPWINNCVGFYNRKFFLQLLCNALASLIFISVHGFVVIFRMGATFDGREEDDLEVESIDALGLASYGLVCVMLFIAVALAVPLVPFLKFHIGLLSHNSTTIESIPPIAGENRDGGSRHTRPSYDIGVRRNVEQVLGPNCIWWWVPFHMHASRPIGDGVRWRQSYLTAIDEEAQRV